VQKEQPTIYIIGQPLQAENDMPGAALNGKASKQDSSTPAPAIANADDYYPTVAIQVTNLCYLRTL
jgi:hypothetical protein